MYASSALLACFKQLNALAKKDFTVPTGLIVQAWNLCSWGRSHGL